MRLLLTLLLPLLTLLPAMAGGGSVPPGPETLITMTIRVGASTQAGNSGASAMERMSQAALRPEDMEARVYRELEAAVADSAPLLWSGSNGWGFCQLEVLYDAQEAEKGKLKAPLEKLLTATMETLPASLPNMKWGIAIRPRSAQDNAPQKLRHMPLAKPAQSEQPHMLSLHLCADGDFSPEQMESGLYIPLREGGLKLHARSSLKTVADNSMRLFSIPLKTQRSFQMQLCYSAATTTPAQLAEKAHEGLLAALAAQAADKAEWQWEIALQPLIATPQMQTTTFSQH